MSNAKKPKSTLQVMMEVVRTAKVKLFHTPQEKAYAVLPVNKHWEVHRVRSVRMKHWLRLAYLRATKKHVQSKVIEEAVAQLESEALFKSAKEKAWLRTARSEDALYIDLGDEGWRVVKIRDGDWQILSRSPVYFRRPPGMLPLPVPQRDGDVALLRKFIRYGSDDDFLLIVTFITWALRYGGPYPMLLFIGDSGSGKSTTARRVQALVDPCEVDEAGPPKSEDDMLVAANNCWLITLGNLTDIKDWLSDALCRTATGGGQRKRMLFTDDDESIIRVKRPVVVTAIDNVVERKDLESRLILIQVPKLDETAMREEEELEKEFAVEAPLIFGGLLTLIARAQKRLPEVRLAAKSRLADLERWGEAVALELSLEPGRFHAAFKASRDTGKLMRLEADPLVWALQEWLRVKGQFSGTATALLECLDRIMTGRRKGDRWPQVPRVLARRLNMLRDDGHILGFEVEKRTLHGVVQWHLRLKPTDSPHPSHPSPPEAEKDFEQKDR